MGGGFHATAVHFLQDKRLFVVKIKWTTDGDESTLALKLFSKGETELHQK